MIRVHIRLHIPIVLQKEIGGCIERLEFNCVSYDATRSKSTFIFDKRSDLANVPIQGIVDNLIEGSGYINIINNHLEIRADLITNIKII